MIVGGRKRQICTRKQDKSKIRYWKWNKKECKTGEEKFFVAQNNFLITEKIDAFEKWLALEG